MQQEKIWDYFQNSPLPDQFFPEIRARYLLRYLRTGQCVLNIGVGSGALERLGLAKGVEMYALDPNEKTIERLRNVLSLGERAKVGYAQLIPFPSNFFDAVVMSEVLEHLDDDVLSASLHEVLRVLKPGGCLIGSTPYRENLSDSLVVCPKCGEVFHRWWHVQSFDKNIIREILLGHGYSVHTIFVTAFIDWKRMRRNLLKLLLATYSYIQAKRGKWYASSPALVFIAKK